MPKSRQERMEARVLRMKQNRERQGEYIAQMNAIKLTDDQKALMKSTKHFGQKLAKKDQLREDITRERVGLKPIHMHLYREVSVDDNLFYDTSLTLPNSLPDTLFEPLDNAELREPAPKLGPELHTADPELEAHSQQVHVSKVVYDAQGDVVALEGLPADLYPELIIHSLLHDDNVTFPRFSRIDTIEAERASLPSFGMQHYFLELLGKTDVLLVKGSTGSGKSTQIPQFLLEGGYSSLVPPYMMTGASCLKPQRDARYGYGGKIVVTQPRRIAAIGVSSRIAEELGQATGDTAGYIIKQNSCIDNGGKDSTRVVFVTEGVLLKMIEADFLVSDTSVIILDEAHERTINLDLLIGLLGRICATRRSLFNSWLAKYKDLILNLTSQYVSFCSEPNSRKSRNGKVFGDVGGGDALAAQRYYEKDREAEQEEQEENESGEEESGKGEEDTEVSSTSNECAPCPEVADSSKLTFQRSRSFFQAALLEEEDLSLSEYFDSKEYAALLKELAVLCRDPPPATPLKLIIMSATLHQKELLENDTLFHCKPLVFEIPMRTYPVAIHYEVATEPNYVQAAIDKTIMIHKYYDPGSILIFLSGKREIEKCIDGLNSSLLRKGTQVDKKRNDTALRKQLHDKHMYRDTFDNTIFDPVQDISDDDGEEGYESNPVLKMLQDYANEVKGEARRNELEAADRSVKPPQPPTQNNPASMTNEAIFNTYNTVLTSNTIANTDQQQDKQEVEQLMKEFKECETRRHTGVINDAPPEPIVLPLYGTLDIVDQSRIFSKKYQSKAKYRLIIVSTNVAEASITIPNIRYVVDAGKAKEKKEYNAVTALTVQFISKANADQRAGRAGRTAPGHCFRLYSPGLFQRMHDFPVPEILRLPITGLILAMLKLGASDVRSFPFVTHPGSDRLDKALAELVVLDAIREKSGATTLIDLYTGSFISMDNNINANTKVTKTNYVLSKLGNLMAAIPLCPRMSKLVIKSVLYFYKQPTAHGSSFLIYAILLASGYYSQLSTIAPIRWPVTSGSGDALSKLFTICALLCFKDKHSASRFCKDYCLRYDEAHQVLTTAIQVFKIISIPPFDDLFKQVYAQVPNKEVIMSTIKVTTPATFTPELRTALNWLLMQSFPDQLAFRESTDSGKYVFQGVSARKLLETPNKYKDLQEVDEIQGTNQFNLTTQQVDLFLQYKPYTNIGALSHTSDIYCCADSLQSFPPCILYTSARVELYVDKTIEMSAGSIEEIKKALRISVHLEGVVEVSKALLCQTQDFLISPCVAMMEQTNQRYDRQKDMVVGESMLHYVGLPLVDGNKEEPGFSIGSVLVGPCTELYPGRRYIDEQLEAKMSPYILSTLLRSIYHRRFLAAILTGDVLPDLKCLNEKVSVIVRDLSNPRCRKSSRELDIALLNIQECGAYSKAGIIKYYEVRCAGLNQKQQEQVLENDRLATSISHCYRTDYHKAFIAIWKRSIQFILNKA
ncbi:ATP-dependent RNA helicase DHR1, putative [Giardia lamblia P15]|uniref:ATP-dependent RNA helicase DHR1, putative n=1 Tax=Giardia intestinalis (strain P15) TaxID=658858 RepID=E1EYA9_GIAIA|nr:ATP-dependent RNA helicase DHR1, putative [Giardia lamblia P15]